jgi:hypothetical protein
MIKMCIKGSAIKEGKLIQISVIQVEQWIYGYVLGGLGVKNWLRARKTTFPMIRDFF